MSALARRGSPLPTTQSSTSPCTGEEFGWYSGGEEFGWYSGEEFGWYSGEEFGWYSGEEFGWYSGEEFGGCSGEEGVRHKKILVKCLTRIFGV